MRTWLLRLSLLAGLLFAAIAGLFVVAWFHAEAEMATVYEVRDPPIRFAGDAAERERGAHLYTVLGCVACHGEGGLGRVFIDAGPVAFVVAPNLTPAALAERYGANDLATAIRHGVGPDGRPLRVMPSGDFIHLTDADTAALVAHLQALPDSGNNPGSTEIRPLGRVLHLFGKLHLVPAASLDHSPRQRTSPPPGPTAEYGAYLAQVCTGCHGADWAGQRVPGTPPELPPASNLTPHANGLAGWTEADFARVFREGKRPDGSEVHPFMPWRTYGVMTNDEVTALWRHLSGLPAKPGQPKAAKA